MKSLHLRSSLVIPKLLILAAAVLCWPAISNAQPAKAGSAAKAQGSADKAKGSASKSQAFSPGIEVGAKVPAISLKDQSGETVSLQSMLQTGPVALVVFRSADW